MDNLFAVLRQFDLEIIVGLGMAFFTIVMARIQIVRTRRTRTSDLYDDFYNADHYRRVVHPVFCIHRKLAALEGPAREEYIEAILVGWQGKVEDPVEAWHALIPEKHRSLSAMEQHFFVESSTENFTEHEALTSFMYFWVRAHRMIITHLIDKKLFAELFCNSFKYYDDFLHELRTRICETGDPSEIPSWVPATAYIQNLLEDADCKSLRTP